MHKDYISMWNNFLIGGVILKNECYKQEGVRHFTNFQAPLLNSAKPFNWWPESYLSFLSRTSFFATLHLAPPQIILNSTFIGFDFTWPNYFDCFSFFSLSIGWSFNFPYCENNQNTFSMQVHLATSLLLLNTFINIIFWSKNLNSL